MVQMMEFYLWKEVWKTEASSPCTNFIHSNFPSPFLGPLSPHSRAAIRYTAFVLIIVVMIFVFNFLFILLLHFCFFPRLHLLHIFFSDAACGANFKLRTICNNFAVLSVSTRCAVAVSEERICESWKICEQLFFTNNGIFNLMCIKLRKRRGWRSEKMMMKIKRRRRRWEGGKEEWLKFCIQIYGRIKLIRSLNGPVFFASRIYLIWSSFRIFWHSPVSPVLGVCSQRFTYVRLVRPLCSVIAQRYIVGSCEIRNEELVKIVSITHLEC